MILTTNMSLPWNEQKYVFHIRNTNDCLRRYSYSVRLRICIFANLGHLSLLAFPLRSGSQSHPSVTPPHRPDDQHPRAIIRSIPLSYKLEDTAARSFVVRRSSMLTRLQNMHAGLFIEHHNRVP